MIPIIFKIKYSEAATGGVTENTWVICVPVNFEKFLRRPFLQNTSGRLLLSTDNIWKTIKNDGKWAHISGMRNFLILPNLNLCCTKESEHSVKFSFSSYQCSDCPCFCNKWKIIDRFQLLWFVKSKCETIIFLI